MNKQATNWHDAHRAAALNIYSRLIKRHSFDRVARKMDSGALVRAVHARVGRNWRHIA